MAGVVSCSRRLLWRPSTVLPAPAGALFSTSSSAAAKAAPQHVRAGKQAQAAFKKKNKNTGARGKAPAPGERKAFRKRIVLSNNNALAVPDLAELTGADLQGGAEGAAEGRIFALPDGLVDQLRAVEAFKPTQCFPLFRRPSVLVRRETVALTGQMQAAATGETRQALRLVIDGERIAGKSILLLQAMAFGFLNDWVVISIPEAQELTTACTEYAALPETEPTQWAQPTYVFRLLQAVRTANERVLGRLRTVRGHEQLANPVAAGSTLLQLLEAAKEADHAWPVFQALWAELREPGAADRPPVLLALDGLAHIMRVSDYRSPSFARIHAHDLALVRLFVDALAGAAPLPHGGAVLAATSRGNAPASPSLALGLAQRAAEARGEAPPAETPYLRGYDERVAAALQTVGVLSVQGVSHAEARALMEYWAQSGLLRARVDAQAVAGTWSLAGNGVLGEMERASLLSLRP